MTALQLFLDGIILVGGNRLWHQHVHSYESCSNGVTVSTLDFESSDGGSNPPRT